MSDRRYKLIGSGLPGKASFKLDDLLDGQVVSWDIASSRWVPTTASSIGGVWGAITGTLSAQTDLQTALDGKVDDAQVLTNVPSGALFTDTIYTLPFTDNSANWNTAYGWGDHGVAGYAASTDLGDYLPLTGGILTGTVRTDVTDTENNFYVTASDTGLRARVGYGIVSLRTTLGGGSGSERSVEMTHDAGVALYYNGNSKFTTTNTGISTTGGSVQTGDALWNDGSATSPEINLQSTSAISYMYQSGSTTQMGTTTTGGITPLAGMNMVRGGATSIYYNGVLKAGTSATGLDVTGVATSTTAPTIMSYNKTKSL